MTTRIILYLVGFLASQLLTASVPALLMGWAVLVALIVGELELAKREHGEQSEEGFDVPYKQDMKSRKGETLTIELVDSKDETRVIKLSEVQDFVVEHYEQGVGEGVEFAVSLSGMKKLTGNRPLKTDWVKYPGVKDPVFTIGFEYHTELGLHFAPLFYMDSGRFYQVGTYEDIETPTPLPEINDNASSSEPPPLWINESHH